MWLQPWFFSILVLHFGHFFVFAKIQLAVSLSFTHFWAHSANCAQLHGSCASSPHLKQKGYEQSHRTVVTPEPIATFSQPGAGQYFIVLLLSMKFLKTYVEYFSTTDGSTRFLKKDFGTHCLHLCSGQ
jgi:hypothetical protein